MPWELRGNMTIWRCGQGKGRELGACPREAGVKGRSQAAPQQTRSSAFPEAHLQTFRAQEGGVLILGFRPACVLLLLSQ